jgi:hypothetical protein
MSQCVVTCTWLIMGHGKVFRYSNILPTTTAPNKEPVFDPLSNPFEKIDNVHYLSMVGPKMNSKSMAANGYQALELFFLKQTQKKPALSMKEIEDLCEKYENDSHINYDALWTIYRGIRPWEKYFSGYKDNAEKERWTKIEDDIEGPGSNEPRVGLLGRVYDLLWSGVKYRCNAALDPNVKPGEYNGHAFCRLMMVNIDRGNRNIENYFFGNHTRCQWSTTADSLQNDITEDEYGFIIPNFFMPIREVWQICIEKTKALCVLLSDYFRLTPNNYTSKVFVYDSTCNGWKREKTFEEEKKMIQYYGDKRSKAIYDSNITGGTLQYGGDIISDLRKEMDEQSKEMLERTPVEKKEDENNFNEALKFALDWKPEVKSEVGGKNTHGRRKPKRKFYKKTKKNKKSKKQQKTRTRNNRKTRK